MKNAAGALAARILEICAASRPERLRKADLERMRLLVIASAAGTLSAVPPPEATEGQADETYVFALRAVLHYGGRNRFMLSLKDAIAAHGSLTEAQVEAVLAPPFAQQTFELRRFGVLGVEYRWEAEDALKDARKRALDRARAEKVEPAAGGGD